MKLEGKKTKLNHELKLMRWDLHSTVHSLETLKKKTFSFTMYINKASNLESHLQSSKDASL